MTQKERVLRYISEFGSISPMEAFFNLGITKLATVISYLKSHEGYIFYQHWEKTKNRWKEPVCYMRYWLSYQQYLKDMQDVNEKGELIKCY